MSLQFHEFFLIILNILNIKSFLGVKRVKNTEYANDIFKSKVTRQKRDLAQAFQQCVEKFTYIYLNLTITVYVYLFQVLAPPFPLSTNGF